MIHKYKRFLFRFSPAVFFVGLLFALTTTAVLQANPSIVATKTDTLIVDNDADNQADPGDTIRYTTWVTNSGTTNAGNVFFNDTIDGNTTLVPGSLRTTPIARNDAYEAIGNVGITVPAGSGVLANDNDPDGQTVSVIAAAGGTANGGAFSIGADGSFSYQSPAGFEGADSFTYTIQDSDGNQDPATVFVTVSEVIWFVDQSAGSGGTGVMSNPFNDLTGASGYSNAADEAGDIIFLYSSSGSYNGGVGLLNEQYLIGQGASASIAAITGITVPPHSNTLPAAGGARPVITTTGGDGVQLAQNNELRGFNIGDTAGAGISDNGGTVGTLTVSEVAISGTGGGFETDNGGVLAVTLDSLSANSGARGLSLANTTGSFSVTGTGGANSGGTLSGHSSAGVYLNNVTNVSLTDMVINQSATSSTEGIDAASVTNLSLTRATITAGSGNSYALLGSGITNLTDISSIFDGGGGSVANIDGVRITNLLGTNSFTNSTFRNGKDINLLIENNSNGGGQDRITISGVSFSDSAGGDHLQVEADGTANLKLVVNASGAGNTSFSGTGQDGMQLEAEGNATFEAVVTGATISNNLGSAVNIGAVVNGRMIARVHNLTGLTSGGTNVLNAIGFDNSNIDVTFENNTVNLGGTAFNGVRVIQEGNGTITTRIANNSITGVGKELGILVQGRAGTGGNGRINATINNNTVNVSGALSLDGIEVTSGSSAGGDTNTICLNMFGNNSTSANYDGYFLRHRTGSTFQLQDFAGPATSAGITTWVNTTKSNTGSVFVSGASGFTAAPSACATPTVPVASAPSSTTIAANAADQVLLAKLNLDADILPARQAVKKAIEETTAVFTPKSAPVAAKASNAPALSGETVTVSLGELNPGQQVRITFDVTIDTPQTPATNSQVCNQGVINGDNFANVLTDDLAVGGSADPTCTLLAPGAIIIAKDQQPDGGDSFGFSSDIPGNATFSVSGDSSTTMNNVPPGSYTVTENDPSASFFVLIGLTCDDGSSAAPSTTDLSTRTATVNLESGETVTCTFTNEEIGRLEVVKSVDATPNGETFDLLIDGNVEASGVGDGGSTGEVGVATGTHSVSETGTNLSNYDSSIECVLDGTSTVVAGGSGTGLANIPVNAGDDVVCTITNTHKTGNLEVVKELLPATDTGSFDMRIDTTTHVATGGNGTTTGEQSVTIGTHLVSETGNGPTNLFDYTVSISCKDNNGTGNEVAATPNGTFAWDVTVNEGDDIVCTITNQRNSTILVQKSVVQGDPNNPNQTFDLNISRGNVVLGQSSVLPGSSPVGLGNLTPDNYTVNEVNLAPGWTLENITCVNNFGNSTFGTFTPGDNSLEIMLAAGSEVLCTFTNTFNRAPVANDDSYTATEDTTLNVAAPGVLDNDTDADGDALTAVLDTTTSNGSLTLNADGSFTYIPDVNYCGADSFTYHANDGQADSNVATVNFTVECVDDPPIVSVDVASQTVQYSDLIDTVTVTAADIDSHPLNISDDAPSNLSTGGSCTPDGTGGTSCTWTLTGKVLVAAGTYNITFTVADATTGVDILTELVVTPEDARVTFDEANPVAVSVDSPGSDSSEPFTLLVRVQEKSESGSNTAPGDINLANVTVTLEPVGPGSPVAVVCASTGSVAQFDYTAVLEVMCDFSGASVNTYVATATINGGYYNGSGEDAVVIYDASLGFTTGGGWFYWPGTTDRTTFGYTMKYNKKGTKVQGNLVLIRHLDGQDEIYRIKSNALYGLSLGEATDDNNGETFGWAVFSGKSTYLEPGMSEPIGNYKFTVYVEDRNEPGTGVDRIWIEVRDKDGNVVADLSIDPEAEENAVPLNGGNIVVPHNATDNGSNGSKNKPKG